MEGFGNTVPEYSSRFHDAAHLVRFDEISQLGLADGAFAAVLRLRTAKYDWQLLNKTGSHHQTVATRLRQMPVHAMLADHGRRALE
jgi:hypothetical protein